MVSQRSLSEEAASYRTPELAYDRIMPNRWSLGDPCTCSHDRDAHEGNAGACTWYDCPCTKFELAPPDDESTFDEYGI